VIRLLPIEKAAGDRLGLQHENAARAPCSVSWKESNLHFRPKAVSYRSRRPLSSTCQTWRTGPDAGSREVQRQTCENVKSMGMLKRLLTVWHLGGLPARCSSLSLPALHLTCGEQPPAATPDEPIFEQTGPRDRVGEWEDASKPLSEIEGQIGHGKGSSRASGCPNPC
jgi:hypothetical protein